MTKTRHLWMSAALLVCAPFAGPPAAADVVVRGDVVRVDPLVDHHARTVERGDCAPTKPAAGSGLVALLAWDLRTNCRLEEVVDEVVTGYRVHYEWEGRRWQTTTRDHPGDTISLRLTID